MSTKVRVPPSPTTNDTWSNSPANDVVTNGWSVTPGRPRHETQFLFIEAERPKSVYNSVARQLGNGEVFVEKLEFPLVFVFRVLSLSPTSSPLPVHGAYSSGDIGTRNKKHTTSPPRGIGLPSTEKAFDDRPTKSAVRRPKYQESETFQNHRTSFKSWGSVDGPGVIVRKAYEYFSLKPAMSAIFAPPALSTVDELPSESNESLPIPDAAAGDADTSKSRPDGSAPFEETPSQKADDGDATTSSSTSPSQRRRRKHGLCLDVEEMKVLTSRLNLTTRRPSVQAWRQEHLLGNGSPFAVRLACLRQTCDVGAENDDATTTKWSSEFRDGINASLDWLKSELTSMKEEDAILARRLLNIRKDMYRLKLSMCTERHRMILDEAMEIEEERDELEKSRDCDITPEPFSPTLKQYGVTRMNIHSRRFSVF